MSGINYIPQYENLNRLEQVVRDLEALSTEGNHTKNRIVNQVDDIIRILNKENPDYAKAIDHIENFLQRYESNKDKFKHQLENGETEKSSELPKDLKDQESQLIDQNQRLKEILAQKKEYNAGIEQVNSEYEQHIDHLVDLIQNHKLNEEKSRVRYVTDTRKIIEKERKEEVELYEQLLQNEDIIHKMNRILIDTYKIFDAAREREATKT